MKKSLNSHTDIDTVSPRLSSQSYMKLKLMLWLGAAMLWLGAAMLLVAAVSIVLWKQEQNRIFGVPLVGYNHTGFGIDFYVDGNMGGAIGAHGGGGSHACCVDLPAHFKAGLAVRVKWKSTVGSPDGNTFKTLEVQVPEYDSKKFGLLVVHFLPDDSIKVLATYLYDEHPDYPIKDSF
ncbi:MAG: DUF3304 domain-containing protein [Comamonadaceae bacterium]|nr:MAG: DUF3304 domain-containing protein [Comamonadaceae bacterium]